MAGFAKTKLNIVGLPEGKKERAKNILDKVVFMEKELKKLQKSLEKNGWTEEYKNGSNQFGVKKSAEADAYNSLIKNYTSAMKQLEDMMPEEIVKKGFSKLDDD